MALIELADKIVTDLPLDHGALLQEIGKCRASEQSECQVLSEMENAAVQRLMTYSKDPHDAYANARFLQLAMSASDAIKGRCSPVNSDLAAEARLSSMVSDLSTAFEKQGINVANFKPNHFATLSVYHAMFLRTSTTRSANGLRRWCFPLKQYVAGDEIEPEETRQQHLASQCLPRHYDASVAEQPAGQERSGQAIAAAPVTCELCHKGFPRGEIS